MGLRAPRSIVVPRGTKSSSSSGAINFPGLGRPIRINRRWDSGILTAVSRSSPAWKKPSWSPLLQPHSYYVPATRKSCFRQRRMPENPPTARAVITSAKSGETELLRTVLASLPHFPIRALLQPPIEMRIFSYWTQSM